MSRIGKMPVTVPAGVEVTIDGSTVTVKGAKGELTRTFPEIITIKQEGDELIVERPDDSREAKSYHGLVRSLVANMVEGVSNGFTKKLQLVGVGYRAALKGKDLEMQLGFSHPVVVEAPREHRVRGSQPNRDHRERPLQGAGRPSCCEHPQVAQARALQGQGHSLRRRVRPPQGRQGRQGLGASRERLRSKG